jgi:protein-tyrosine kinase
MTLPTPSGLLRARWRMIAVAALAGATLAAGAIAWLPPTFTAQAQVLLVDRRVHEGAAAAPQADATRRIATQVDILTSQRVALAAVDAMGLVGDPRARARWGPAREHDGSIRHVYSDRLLDGLRVAPVPESDVIGIAYRDTDPAFAAAAANAFLSAYVEVTEALQTAPGRGAGAQGPDASGAVGLVVLPLTRAVAPVRASWPRPTRDLSLGTLAGALLGLAVALVAETRNRRIRGASDLERASGRLPIGSLHAAAVDGGRREAASPVPVRAGAGGSARDPDGPVLAPALPMRPPIGQILVQAGLIHPPEVERILAWARQEGVRFGEAAVATRHVTEEQVDRALAVQFDFPVLQRGRSAVSQEVIAAYAPQHPLSADVRRLRTRLDTARRAAGSPPPFKAIAVISPAAADGKTFLAANLAVCCAQSGRRTLLIDADLRAGRMHRVFGLSNASGLSAMLNRRIVTGVLQRVPGLTELTVLTCGPEAPNPSELLSRDAFGELLEAFARSFDWVIVDTPGTAEEPDAGLIAQRAGAVLLVAREDHSPYGAVARLAHGDGGPSVTLLGCVLNRG